ncbi:alpha/beta fold hydrolase [Sphingomonas sp. dw_22]|uniref:alpha/beta hydrolase n=1 Tax=Sphingomonas sp. dw_22 TaxID=2721175 RepID=UPI001BD30ADE|nr:alpha/beta fold hydrolase [Sphingomonas sp. dw_22]
MGVRRCLAVLALVLVPPSPANADDLKLAPGMAIASDGAQVHYEVGTLHVPENRARPGGRQIGVGVLRIRARAPTGAPPIFLLVGGPGVTLLDTLEDQGPAAKRRLRMWLDDSESADLVIVEQRGYTLRGDMLELKNPAMPLDRPARVEDDVALTMAQARAAAGEHPGIDLAGYTIAECADDVDAARRLLGYDRISLLGASFGSQWSFAVMRRHPETVARALISAVEPLDNGYDMPSQVFAALQRIAFEAERDPALAPFIPKGGLIAAVRAVHDRFAKGPVTVQVPGAGAVTLGLGDFQLALREQAVDAAVWPAFVIDLYNGRYQGWARQVIEQRKANTVSLIGPLIDTATGMSAAREAQLRTDPALDMLGSWNFAAYLASADAWPTDDLGDAFRLPVLNPTPVLFVQGDWDTNTPVENLTGLLPYFPNARAIIVHRGQHTGALALLRDRPELAAAARRFLKDGTLDDLPAEAALAPVRFALPEKE